MKRVLLIALCLTCLTNNIQAQEPVVTEKKEAPSDHPSYAIGLNIGRELASSGFTNSDLVFEDFLKGLVDSLTGAEPRCKPAELEAAFQTISQRIDARAEAATKTNAETAKTFLDENKKKEGVITLPSGLQYKILATGKGAQPTLTSTVKVHYEGKLINGKVFDSSIARGEPIEFPVARVIAGWTEALQRMRVGDKWQLFIPPELAYKERGAPPDIGPNSALIFQVELLDVK
jgi:FKBP-type peptidyl-prolyl cis-trans isomerase FklB